MRALGAMDGRATCRLFSLAALMLAGCASGPRPWRAAWHVVAEAPQSGFGRRAVGVGDLNGDGYGDLAVGAPGFEDGRGKAYVYCGSPKGLGARPCWSRSGDASGDGYGESLGQAGDVNGDGLPDLFVAAPSWRRGPGKVELYYGRPEGPAQQPDWEQSPAGSGKERFGDPAQAAGDVNGDGYDDLLVGAYQALSGAGRVQLYLGSQRGLSSQPSWEGQGGAAGDHFGAALSAAGDVDGDGHGDLLVGAPLAGDTADFSATAQGLAAAGKLYLYYGAAQGLRPKPRLSRGGEAGAGHGARAFLLGWTDGSGKPQLLVAEPGAESGCGKVLVMDAASGAALKEIHGKALGVQGFGAALAPAGDVDGDGYDDLVAGGQAEGVGRVWLWRGGTQGIDPAAGIPLLGTGPAAGFGRWAAPAGDLDGDGMADVVVSSGEASGADDEVEVFYGKDFAKAGARKPGRRMNVYLPLRAKR